MSGTKNKSRTVSKSRFIHLYGAAIRSNILKSVELANKNSLPERRVANRAALTVANRVLNRGKIIKPETVVFNINREVAAFISLAVHDNRSEMSLRHSDLLPISHPASTRSHSMTASALRHARARWIAADPMVSDEARPLVVTAYSSRPGSFDRLHAFTRMTALSSASVPRYLIVDAESSLSALVAVAGFGIGGNSKLARSLRAQMQRRDRYGKFAFMGGGFNFSFRLGKDIFSASGRVVGASGESDVEVEIIGNANLPDGIYAMPSGKGTASRAILSKDYLRTQKGVRLDTARGDDGKVVEESEIRRLDAPTGWNRADVAAPEGKEVFVSDDGYFALKDGDTGEYSLHRADLSDNSIGEKVADGKSWADVQRAAKKDAPAYEKVLEKADRDEKSAAPAPRVRDDSGEAYDRIRDEMLEEGWSKSDEMFDDELMKRADAAGVPKAPARQAAPRKTADRTKIGERDNGRKLIAWGRKQSDSKTASIADQGRNKGGLTDKQWASLERAAAKDPDFDSFMDLPSGMSEDEANELADWARSQEFDAYHRVFNRRTSDNPDIAVFEQSSSASVVDVEGFLRQDADGFVSEAAWDNIKIAKAMADTKDPSDVRSPLNVEPSIRTQEERDIAAGMLLDEADNILDRAADLPDGAYRSYLDSKARNKIDAADGLVDDNADIKARIDSSRGDLDQEIRAMPQRERGVIPADLVLPKPDEEKSPLDKALIDAVIPSEVENRFNPLPKPIKPQKKRDDNTARKLEEMSDEELKAELAKHNKINPRPWDRNRFTEDSKYPVNAIIAELQSRGYDVSRTQKREPGYFGDYSAGDQVYIATKEGEDALWPIFSPVENVDSDLTAPEDQIFDDVDDSISADAVDFNAGTDVDDARKSVEDAINSGSAMRFDYNGRERLFTPEGIWENQQNGNINVVGFDNGDGSKKTYTLQKMENPEPRPEPGSGEPTNIVDGDYAAVRSALEDAIDTNGKVRFVYNDKERVFTPARIYNNPKTGNTNVVGFDETNNEERTYTIEKIDAVSSPDSPAARGVAPEDQAMFDEIFTVPEGAHKVDIFSDYDPVGKTDEESADYTDDPLELSTKFSDQELVLALRQAILPDSDSGDPATGYGLLEFEAGDESVPAEALYDALRFSGQIDTQNALAAIYDSGLPETDGETNVDRVNMMNDEMFGSPEYSPLRTELPDTNAPRGERSLLPQERQLDSEVGASTVRQIRDHEETNSRIVEIADALNNGEIVGFDDAFERFYPLSISDDPQDREAFKAAWGAFMSLDGGDSGDLGMQDEEGSRVRMIQVIAEYNSNNGIDADAEESYFEMLDVYGQYPEFIEGRQAIRNGNDDITSDTSAAAFYRLVSAGARPNDGAVYRVLEMEPGDPEYAELMTEGSVINIDARSFTKMDLTDGSLGSGLFFSTGNMQRVVIEALPGEIDVLDLDDMSAIPDESEVIGYGTFEVASIRQEKNPAGGTDIFVQIRRTDQTASKPSVGRQEFSGIESWEKIGGQAGSNEGGFYRDSDGNEYYVKTPKSSSHASNEVLASAFYEELGVPAAGMYRGDDNGELRIVSPLIPEADTRDFEFRVYNGDDEYLEKVREGFVADAWLANWDSVGLAYDNIVTDGDGNPVRVDPGGSLMYRAQGAAKGAMFGDTVDELDTLRDYDMNREAAEVFSSTPDDQLLNGAKAIRDIAPSRIDEIVDSIVDDPDDAALIKARLKARRQDIIDRFDLTEGADDPELYPDPIPLTDAMGYQAQDLQPGDISAQDSFVIERVFRDDETPKGKVSVQGYYPGHESQRKEWNETTEIEASRGGTIPPKGTKPALHRPRKPRSPRTQETFTGDMRDLVESADSWSEVADIIRGKEIIYFDYETTGIGEGELNRPVQIGAVRVVDGEVVERFNAYMNPEFRLSDWSKENLRRPDGEPVTDEWLETQASMKEVHSLFMAFAGDRPILGGQNVPFDTEVLRRTLDEQGLDFEIGGTIDSLPLARATLPKWNSKDMDGPMQVGRDNKRRSSYSLGPVAEYLGVELNDWHSADADAEAAWDITNAMLDRAIDPDFDTPTDVFDGTESSKIALEQAEYDAEMSVYADELADYEAAKAVAAAWNCGGSGITAAVGPDEGPCDVPNIDDMISNATPRGEIGDRDGTSVGSTSDDSSLVDADPDAADVDRTDKDGVDTKDPYAGEEFPPTPQQRDVVDAVLTGDNVVVRALAGTGKTSTLKLIARRLKRDRPNDRIAYVAFNKSIQLEAESSMPNNVESRTGDSIAWRAIDSKLTKKRTTNNAHGKPSEGADRFGVGPSVNPDKPEQKLSKIQTFRALSRAITKYTTSADDEIGQQHFDFEADVPELWIEQANAMWADLTSVDGWLPFNNNHATKIWALSKPDLSKPGSGLQRPATVIFFDEAQDINPVIGKVIADQKIQVIYVGDGNQAIYGFRGAEDELQKVSAPHDLPLTKSWRFGPEVAGVGNRFLALLGSPYRIDGGGPNGTIVDGEMDDADAVLVRTNAGAFAEIFKELEAGRTVAITKNHKDDLQNFVAHAEWLKSDKTSDRPPRMHEDLAPFSTWDEVLVSLDEDDGQSRKMKTLVEMIDDPDMGLDGMREMLSRVKAYNPDQHGTSEAITPEDVTPGSSGQISDGLEYRIDGDTIIISGKKTFDNKERIKDAGFKWNGDDRSWRRAVKTEQKRAEILRGLQSGNDDQADVVITTAHRSKGLEWDRVRIGGDFWGPKYDEETDEVTLPEPEELRLAYVAVTRAKKELDTGALSWVFSQTSETDELPNVPDADAPDAPETDLPEPEGPAVDAPEPVSSDVDVSKYELEDEGEGSYQAVGDPNSWIVQQASDTWIGQVAGEKIEPSSTFEEAKEKYDALALEVASREEASIPAQADTPSEALPDDGDVSGVSEAPEGVEGGIDLVPEQPVAESRKAPDGVIEDALAFDPSTQASFNDDVDDILEDLDGTYEVTTPKNGKLKRESRAALKRVSEAITRYKEGEISLAEAAEIARVEEANYADIQKGAMGPDKMIAEFVALSLRDARRVLDGSVYGPTKVGKGLPPEGSGLGFDKNGVFITPGMRVRDKWGYAGTVVRYNSSGGFNNVYILKDLDHRDPSKMSEKKRLEWGPGFIDSKGTKTLTVISEGDDNSPYVPVVDKKKGEKAPPADIEKQLEMLEKLRGDDDETPVGVVEKPETETPDSGEPAAGTTEAIRENIEERSGAGDAPSADAADPPEAPEAPEAETPEASGKEYVTRETAKKFEFKTVEDYVAAGKTKTTVIKTQEMWDELMKEATATQGINFTNRSLPTGRSSMGKVEYPFVVEGASGNKMLVVPDGWVPSTRQYSRGVAFALSTTELGWEPEYGREYSGPSLPRSIAQNNARKAVYPDNIYDGPLNYDEVQDLLWLSQKMKKGPLDSLDAEKMRNIEEKLSGNADAPTDIADGEPAAGTTEAIRANMEQRRVEAARNINEALRDSENPDYTANDQTILDLIERELDSRGPDAKFITIDPPGGFETTIKVEDAIAILNRAGE